MVLLMVAAVACDNSEPESTADPIKPSATLVHPSVGICDRTEHVRNAILARIDGVDDCAAVTAPHLATIDGKIHPAGGENAASFQPGDFDGLTALETLDLRGAGFTFLEAGVFDGLTSLAVLDLRGSWYIAYPDWLGSAHRNSLESLEEGLFAGLASLRELYLGDGHRLTSLEAGIFDDLSALVYLDLGGNPLTSLEAGVFDNLTSLTELQLSYAGETAPPNGLFDKLTSLRELSMVTGVAQLEAGVLTGFPVTRLSLYTGATLPRELFQGLTSLKQLDLSGHFHFPPNPLTTLEAGIFEGLDALEELNMYRNRLTTLEVGAFDGLSSLTSLDLGDNELASLEAGVFRGLSSLTSLDLSINELTSLEKGVFGELTSLDTLSLHSNPLTEIDSFVFTDPVNLERLELPLTTDVPSPSTTLSPASSEEWVCSESQHFLICSVRTGTAAFSQDPTPTPETHQMEALYPCGPTFHPYTGGFHKHFLHWTKDGSQLVFDLGETIWTVDIGGTRLRKIADANLGPDWEFTYGAAGARRSSEHGRQGPVHGQRLRGTAVAQHQVRGGVPEGIPKWD